MLLKWVEEPLGPQISIQFFVGDDTRHLRYTETMVMAPGQQEAVQDALVCGFATALAVEPASATLALGAWGRGAEPGGDRAQVILQLPRELGLDATVPGLGHPGFQVRDIIPDT